MLVLLDWVSGLVTTTLFVPAVPAGVIAVSEVALTKTTLVAALPPIVTVAPFTKPVPVIVTAVPPIVEPEFGVIEVTVGAAAKTGRAMNTQKIIPKIRENKIRNNFPFIIRFLYLFEIGF